MPDDEKKYSENDSVKELIDQHWKYISGVLETSVQDTAVYTKTNLIAIVGFHYKTAMLHGWKHAKEEADGKKYK